MTRSSPPGTAVKLTTRFSAKYALTFSLIIFLHVYLSACGQSFVSQVDLTATAQGAFPQNPTSADPVAPSLTSTFTPPTQTASQILPTRTVVVITVPQFPTETIIPTSEETATSTFTETETQTAIDPAYKTSTSFPANLPTVGPPVLYYSQAGDTRPALAVRFGVSPTEINSPDPLPEQGLLKPSQLLVITNRVPVKGPGGSLMPDSEVVYSPSALDFNVDQYVDSAGGYLKDYREYLSNGWHTGSQVVKRVAIENSINPRLLLSFIEFRSHWITQRPINADKNDLPLGTLRTPLHGLYYQLSWVVQELNLGYYGWREGLLTDLVFPDKSRMRLAPEINAGTVAVQYLFAQILAQKDWNAALFDAGNFSKLHEQLFGSPWLRAKTFEPMYPTDLTQPQLDLPYPPGEAWSLSGGPHSAWGPDGARAALDFAPPSKEHGCVESIKWVTAMAPGLVVRASEGAVMVDLDGDGQEQTGWNILYMHIAIKDRIPVGSWLNTNDRIGHPSCEGGVSTGTHTHIARKYNGEWILADGPAPFVLSGWRAFAGPDPYQGKLVRNNTVAEACTCGSYFTLVLRPD